MNPTVEKLKPKRLGVNDTRVWEQRLRKRVFIVNGQRRESAEWYLRLKESGRVVWFNLSTSNKGDAAQVARGIGLYAKANGIRAAEEKFKRPSDADPRVNVTVGDYLGAVEAIGRLRIRTFLNYRNCLQTIVAQVFGVKIPGSKFDYRSKNSGNQKWTDRIGKIRLERVTPARVTAWQQRRVKDAGNSPVAIASAKRTANSYVRCARSLFSEEIRGNLKGIVLPTTLPFDGVKLFEQGSMKYVSKLDVAAIVTAAKNELRVQEPEVYKVFLLGLFAGMRRTEIDLAEWRMVDWANSSIKLEQTRWLHLKTEDSAGEITIDQEVLTELREFMPLNHSPFIVTAEVSRVTPKGIHTRARRPRNDSARPYYRCQPVFDRLNDWLRSKGVTANKPLHELRKEAGAVIVTKQDIYAASRFLRHSDITTTARHYTDHKGRITVGLGGLLKQVVTDNQGQQKENAA